MKAIFMAGLLLGSLSSGVYSYESKSVPWTKENLDRISRGTFKADVIVSPLGFSEVQFTGSLPASCELGSRIEKEVKGQVVVFLNSRCSQANIESFQNEGMVPINWPSIRKEVLGDFIKIRGVENHKSSFADLIETNYESFYGQTKGYSNKDFAPNGLGILREHIDYSFTINEAEYSKQDLQEHPEWLQYQAKNSTDTQKVVYQVITSLGNGNQEVSFGVIKKTLLNPYKKKARKWAKQEAIDLGLGFVDRASNWFSSKDDLFSIGSQELETEVSTVLVDFSSQEKENYSDKGTYGKGYCYRTTDFVKYSDDKIVCDSADEKKCPLGTSMAFRDLSQPMCEDLQYIRSKGFLAYERGVWVPYKRRKEKKLTSLPKLGINLGVQVEFDKLATEADYGVKVSSRADDIIQYKLEYEYCNEELVVGFGDLGDNHCEQAHKFEVGISSVLYGSEAVMELTGQYTGDRQNDGDDDGRVMLRFSKPLYGMFGVFSLN